MATPKTKKPRADVKVEGGIVPVFALHKIVYGAGKTALQEIFTPVSEKERDELIGCGAARELTEAEQLIGEAMAARKAAAATETPAPSTEGTTETAEPVSTAPTDPDVIE